MQGLDLALRQHQAQVVVQGVPQGQAHQRTQWLVGTSGGQKIVETLPAQRPDMHPELATAVSDAVPQNQVIAKSTIGPPQMIALRLADLDRTCNPLL